MAKYYFLIPVIIGIIAGLLAVTGTADNNNSNALTISKLTDNGSPIMGDPDAPITILEWGDYQCTFCYKFHQDTLDIINEEFIKTGKVKVIFKDFPLNGPDSKLAAESSYCAHDQGKYWEYHDQLYENWAGERTGWITREALSEFAKSINLDTAEFNKCLNESKYENKINSIYELSLIHI